MTKHAAGGSVIPAFLALGIGVLFGLAAYTFSYARGWAYLTDDPAACANCHTMQGQFTHWRASSHRSAAVCNDCHTPEGLIPKYATKALNGVLHSTAFTTGHFPDKIHIGLRNRAVTVKSCQKCHADLTAHIQGDCIACHRNVGH